MKPFIKWAGGKGQLLTQLDAYLPENITNYAEPFIGGGAMLFHIAPDNAAINDYNFEVANLFVQIKDNCDRLIAELNQCRNTEKFFYRIREWDRSASYTRRSALEKAVRILYLNRTCYNGLFRKNSHDQINTPFGHYAKMNFDIENIMECSQYLHDNNVQIFNMDFEPFIDAQNNCFIYADPPYFPEKATSFTSYSDMDWSGGGPQIRLKEALERATQRGCQWMLSNSDTPFIHELYADYDIHIVRARRNINSKGGGRGLVNEVVITNY